MESAILTSARSSGVCPAQVFPPRPSATPAEVAQAAARKTVEPLYNGVPAPVGLAYYGLSRAADGGRSVSVLNTVSVRGSVDANATGLVPFDLGQGAPDGFGIQLNAVLTGVDLFGHTANTTKGPLKAKPFEFWTQNVVEYYPTSRYMVLITNVWNFSGNAALGSAIYAHGSYGSEYFGEVYIAVLPISTPVSYPFNLTLFLNSTVVGGRDAVEFAADLVGPGESFYEPYDYVIFNSTAATGPAKPVAVAPFTASGRAYDPAGLTNDFELDFGGPGGGSNAAFLTADAQIGLAYWNAASGQYVAVPSALNYGGETGETAVGANVAWSNAPGGPGGLTKYGTMTTGPTFLEGLWSAGGREGSYPVTIDANPVNAFEVFTPLAKTLWPGKTAEAAVAPTVNTKTFWLAPGTYTVSTELSDYFPDVTALKVNGPIVMDPYLTPDTNLGIYTPLWAWANGQLPALAVSGAGTPANPYLLENEQSAPIGPAFGLYNDYGYPAYPLLFLLGTTAAVRIDLVGSLRTTTNTLGEPWQLHATNELPLVFDNVSGVALVNSAELGGWFPAEFAPVPAVVAFYASTGNLVANCTIQANAMWGLALLSGGSFFGPGSRVSGGNTVWGNTFSLAPAGVNPEIYQGAGVVLGESNDTVYNNAFVPGSWDQYIQDAALLPTNPYTGEPYEFTNDRWNISVQPASNENFAAGFPWFPLVGSIAGTPWQGGNSWWDYGLARNPFGVLPFLDHESLGMSISPGDFAPLVTNYLYTVTLRVSGLAPGLDWNLTVTNGSGAGNAIRIADGYWTLDRFVSNATSYVIELPNGSYSYLLGPPAGYRWTGGTDPPAGILQVAGANATLVFRLGVGRTYSLTFEQTGLLQSSEYEVWTAMVNGVEQASVMNKTLGRTEVVFTGLTPGAAFNGTYSFVVPPEAVEGLWMGPAFEFVNGGFVLATGNVSVDSNTIISVWFMAESVAAFRESGLPIGTTWSVTFNGTIGAESSEVGIFFLALNGTYTFTVGAKPGYAVSASRSDVVFDNTFEWIWVNVTFTPTGADPAGFGLAPASLALSGPPAMRGRSTEALA
ncbi:MAG TPA: thermopsin family protease [Thermoplasmata archaeon]|nr:thermopsin family protease [Thermoplasmata archaeon]